MAKGKIDGEAADLDLFGNPALPLRDPRGRPAYKKSKENQLLVMTLAARGWSAEQIGPFMGAHPQTIRKYFSRELEHGALFLEGMAMQVLVNKALGGHAASVTKVLDMMEARVAPKSPKAKPEKPVAVGKKEALAAAAQKPTQGWGDLLN